MVLNVLFLILGIANGKESVGTFMIFAYCMLGLTVVAILFAPIYGIVINPKSIKTIGASAFTATAIVKLELPIGLESVGEFAFAYCLKLTNVEVSYTVSSIAENAFIGSNEDKIEFVVSAASDYYMLVDGKLTHK